MALVKLDFKPGINKEMGAYGAENYYFDSDKVRFVNGLPEKIKGWQKLTTDVISGICRGLHAWRANDGTEYLAVGTHTKLYVFTDDTFYAITPTDFSSNLQNQHTQGALGWGAGSYDVSTSTHTNGYGTAATTVVGDGIVVPATTWSFTNFGEHLIANVIGGGVYRWRPSEEGVTTVASRLTNAPLIANYVFSNEQTRTLITLSSEVPFRTGEQDQLLIRWCSQENSEDWSPAVTNTAGTFRVTAGTKLVCGKNAFGQSLIWTDQALYGMLFIGGQGGEIEDQLVYKFDLLGTNCGAVGPNAAVTVNGNAFWMGYRNFFMFDGQIKVIPCSVHHHVFDNINTDQLAKVYAGINSQYNEIWWFYPVSTGTSEISKYVVYNYVENIWYIGSLVRTAWVDNNVFEYPIAAGTDTFLYTHENGTSDAGSSVTAYVETADFDLSDKEGDGQNIMFVDRMIPEVVAYDTGAMAGTLVLTMKSRNYPNRTQTTKTYNITSSTEKVDMRIRGRQASMKFQSSGASDNWRIVSYRLSLQPDGRR